MAAGTSSSIGAGAGLRISSGDIDLCEAHEKMEAMAGHCVWINEFVPVNIPQKRLVDSLLCHLYSEGVCCAIPGLFPARQAVRFKQF